MRGHGDGRVFVWEGWDHTIQWLTITAFYCGCPFYCVQCNIYNDNSLQRRRYSYSAFVLVDCAPSTLPCVTDPLAGVAPTISLLPLLMLPRHPFASSINLVVYFMCHSRHRAVSIDRCSSVALLLHNRPFALLVFDQRQYYECCSQTSSASISRIGRTVYPRRSLPAPVLLPLFR